jgi:hypothetical protein
LSRDVHFISGLMVHKIPFIVTTLGPDADPVMLHIYAAFAERAPGSARHCRGVECAWRADGARRCMAPVERT